VDLTLRNGCKVVRIAMRQVGDDEAILHGIVLARRDDSHEPWITWDVDNGGNTFLGHYFQHYPDALDDYEARVRMRRVVTEPIKALS